MASPAPQAPFGRLLTAMATAFHPDGSLDLEGTTRIASHLVANGNDGLVVSGTTGESPTTSDTEAGDIVRAVRAAVGSSVPVIAGVGTNDTQHSLALAQQAREAGATALLVVTPYYSKPSPAGLITHFTAVAEAGGLPVMIYDVPGRTGLPIPLEVYAALADHPLCIAVKDATGRYETTEAVTELGYHAYSGDDGNILAWLGFGACGLVSVAGHAVAPALRQAMEEFWNGDHAAALATYRRAKPAIAAMMGVSNYGATTAKASMQLLGVLDNRHVRGPLAPLDDHEYAALAAGLTAAGVLT